MSCKVFVKLLHLRDTRIFIGLASWKVLNSFCAIWRYFFFLGEGCKGNNFFFAKRQKYEFSGWFHFQPHQHQLIPGTWLCVQPVLSSIFLPLTVIPALSSSCPWALLPCYILYCSSVIVSWDLENTVLFLWKDVYCACYDTSGNPLPSPLTTDYMDQVLKRKKSTVLQYYPSNALFAQLLLSNVLYLFPLS